LEQQKSDELQMTISKPDTLNTPFFGNMKAEVVFELLIKSNYNTIRAFNHGIYQRYRDSDIKNEPVYQEEKEFIEKLYELVNNYIIGITTKSISTVPFIDLERNLRRFIVQVSEP